MGGVDVQGIGIALVGYGCCGMEGPTRGTAFVASSTGDAVGGGGDQAGIAWNGGESQDFGERFVVELAVAALIPLPFPETVIGGDGQPVGLAQDKERGALAVAEAGEGTVEVDRGVEAAADRGV